MGGVARDKRDDASEATLGPSVRRQKCAEISESHANKARFTRRCFRFLAYRDVVFVWIHRDYYREHPSPSYSIKRPATAFCLEVPRPSFWVNEIVANSNRYP